MYYDTDGTGYSSFGGTGGGLEGGHAIQANDCIRNCKQYNYPTGGNQNFGGLGIVSYITGATSSESTYVGKFGKGAGNNATPCYAGGGGGFYGGACGNFNGGGGGSGYLSPKLIEGTTSMVNGERAGDGYAQISIVKK